MINVFLRNPTITNLQQHQQAQAKACYIIKKAKRESWK